MASANQTPTRTDDSAQRSSSSILRVVASSMVGTTIEWYDFFLYGSAAALIFNRLFFPSFDATVGTLLAFTTYAVGFVARPLGGLVFGHFGDRAGRKSMLVISLLLMGGATFCIGLLPTYSSIGIGAPLLLVLLRLIQGFALGGEWGGAVIMVAEHGDSRRRGFFTSWPQAGAPAGNVLAVAVLAVLTGALSSAQFESWGWRIPFLLSGLLVLVGMYIRLSISESAVFRAAQAEAEAAVRANRAPIAEVLRVHRREVLVAMGARFAENVAYYIFTVFVLSYVTGHLKLSKSFALNAVLIASAVHLIAIPTWGALSDRIGRRPLYLTGAAGVGLWGFAFFALLDTRNWALVVVAVAVGLVLHAAMYGPQAAYFSELFSTRVRYTGASLGYQLASIFAGSLAPIIAVALLDEFGSAAPISVYVLVTALITLAALLKSRETAKSDLATVAVPQRLFGADA